MRRKGAGRRALVSRPELLLLLVVEACLVAVQVEHQWRCLGVSSSAS